MASEMNYLAVVATALVMFGLGAGWYSPLLFGKKWQELVGKSEDELKRADMTRIFGLSFLAYLVASYVLAHFVLFTEASTPTTLLINNLFQRQSLRLWAIDASYYFFAFCLGGVILAIWH
ncbi:MAG: DUF1761 domain-containing protein [Ignavibacteria bacterium]|nr:DUF1761 domain-containing protein [Ignavibacteria bacterium]